MTKDIINLLFGFSFGFFLMQYFAGDEKSNYIGSNPFPGFNIKPNLNCI